MTESVASFLHKNSHFLNKQKVGELLGESDEYYVNIMAAFIQQLDFSDLDFDIALRYVCVMSLSVGCLCCSLTDQFARTLFFFTFLDTFFTASVCPERPRKLTEFWQSSQTNTTNKTQMACLLMLVRTTHTHATRTHITPTHTAQDVT